MDWTLSLVSRVKGQVDGPIWSSLVLYYSVLTYLFTPFFSYEQQEIALNCGTMLRECARYEALAKIMLYSDDFFNFFRYVEVSTFDIASDAFSTFKVSYCLYCVYLNTNLNLKNLKIQTIFMSLQELLTRHKMLCAEFLELNYDKVFSHYQRLLNSENYVTRRQSLKLLGELLLDRHNFTVSRNNYIDVLSVKVVLTSAKREPLYNKHTEITITAPPYFKI